MDYTSQPIGCWINLLSLDYHKLDKHELKSSTSPVQTGMLEPTLYVYMRSFQLLVNQLIMKKILICGCDYSRAELEQYPYGWGTSAEEILEFISVYEEHGYTVKFETSLLQRIFGLTKYKVYAYK